MIKNTWTDEDNYQISREVLEEYVLKKSQKTVSDFIDGVSILTSHEKGSIRVKVQNTKHLLENSKIQNTLSIAERPNCSKAHRIQFDRARIDLGI